MNFRDYTFLGMTQSFCPECLHAQRLRNGPIWTDRVSEQSIARDGVRAIRLVPVKIIERRGRVYFRKRCPMHGLREDFVCSDAKWFDRREFATPAKEPRWMAVEPARGCPFDCGLCTEHEQHTCLGVLEITSSCNLECPMCYAASAPGGMHLSYDDCCRAIDHLVAAEGRPEVLQLSGGEPTIHPEFLEIFKYACGQPIDIVMINSNGVRLARDAAFLESVAAWRHRAEIYLQFDSFNDAAYRAIRGESLVETKLRAIEALGAARIRTILVCTLQAGVNDHEIGAIVRFAQERPWITGVSFQPACYVGRTVLPEELQQRITFPDVIRGVADQCPEVWRETDFTPLPCAHPNAHTLAYAYRGGGAIVPLARFIDVSEHLDLLSGAITFTRPRARELVRKLISRECCGSGGCGGVEPQLVGLSQINGKPAANGRDQVREPSLKSISEEFFSRVLAEDVSPADVFRITTTSFMDAYNFDVRQAMKDCVHFVLPSGHIIPFSAYNLLYRDELISLPPLRNKLATEGTENTERTQNEAMINARY
jgi:7,8-dihydro-6-hydroxymethylpterin dimethyltransferase